MIDEEATFEKFGYYARDLKPKSTKKIVAVCDDCGRVRVFRKQDYCALCRECSYCLHTGPKSPNWKGGKIMRICESCGTVFPVYPSDIKSGGGRFCSPDCKGTWMSKHRIGKNGANWRGGKIMQICEICGTKFPVYPSDIKSGGGKFCSPKCHGRWLSKHNRGENHPLWKGGRSRYCYKWNEPFREYIREKFGRVCFLCPKTEKENGRKLSVHHVNGNKDCGCDDDETCQFVPLCASCHGKMRSKKIDWEKKIRVKMQNSLNGWYI